MAAQLPYTTRSKISVQVAALERNVDRNAVGAGNDREIRQIRSPLDNAFRSRETDRKIFQVARRRHHHGMGKSVVAEGNGDFLCDAHQTPVVESIPANRINSDGCCGHTVLKRTVHCTAWMMHFKAFGAQSFPASAIVLFRMSLCRPADIGRMEPNRGPGFVQTFRALMSRFPDVEFPGVDLRRT